MRTKQVIVVRKDLKMRRGKEIAQGAHASMAVLTNNLIGYPFKWHLFPFLFCKFIYLFLSHKPLRTWLTGRFTKVCVTVDSEEELKQIYTKAKNAGLLCSLIQDAGLTEFGGVPTYTTVAIGPDEEYKINEITGYLKLY
jgi:PTH2 family peptidyl-tRNA hydrolase